MLELLEPLLFLYAVNADAETRCGPFRDEPDLSLPELRDLLDDDGLLRLDNRFALHDVGIEYKDHATSLTADQSFFSMVQRCVEDAGIT